VGYVSVSYGHM